MLLRLGIIRNSDCQYGSPAFPSKKKNGDIILICLQESQHVTCRDPYSFPTITNQ